MPTWSSHDAPTPRQLYEEQAHKLEVLGYSQALKDRIREILQTRQNDFTMPTKALCLALGSLTHHHDLGFTANSSAQLAAFVTLLEAFGIERSNARIHDPAFSDWDRVFLKEMGLCTPDSPQEAREQLKCDEPTIVFMPYLPYPVIELLYASNWDCIRLKNVMIINCKIGGWLDDDNWMQGQDGRAWIPCVRRSIPLFEIAELPSLTKLKEDKLVIKSKPTVDYYREDFGLDRMRLQWIPARRLAAMGDEFWRLRRKEDSEWSRVSKL